jgi:acyl carrier protein
MKPSSLEVAFSCPAVIEPDFDNPPEVHPPIFQTAPLRAQSRPLRIPAKFAARTPEEIFGDLWGFPKSCIDAAVRFHATGAPDALIAMLPGMIEFHLPSGAVKPPADLKDDARLRQDLGLDSLSLTEMAFKMDEVLGVSIEVREVAGIETVGELKAFILGKLDQA